MINQFFPHLKKIKRYKNMAIELMINSNNSQLTVESEKENFKSYELKILWQNSDITHEDIQRLLNTARVNDYVKICCENYATTVSRKSTVEEVEEFIDDCNSELESGPIYLIVTITKHYENYSCIYSFDKMSKYLLGLTDMQFVTVISDELKKTNYYKCINDEIKIITDTLVISNNESDFYVKDNTEVLEKYHQSCSNNLGDKLKIIPQDLIIKKCSGTGEAFNNLIDRVKSLSTLIALIYLANNAHIEDLNYSFSFLGYKNITITIENGLIYNSSIIDIFNWAYSEGNVIDKLGIARNIISLNYVDSIISIDKKVFESIISSYNLYLKKHVENYILLKEEFTKKYLAYSEKYIDQVHDLNKTLKSNLLGILGYIITVLLTKGFSSGIKSVFTYEISEISSFILLGSLVVLIISSAYYFYNKIYIQSSLDSFRKYYSDIFTEIELQTVINDKELFDETKKRSNRYFTIISIIWILIIVGLFLILDYLSGNNKLLFFINVFN